jgi:hypothetical protein
MVVGRVDCLGVGLKTGCGVGGGGRRGEGRGESASVGQIVVGFVLASVWRRVGGRDIGDGRGDRRSVGRGDGIGKGEANVPVLVLIPVGAWVIGAIMVRSKVGRCVEFAY